MIRHFYHTADLSVEEVQVLLDRAAALKADPRAAAEVLKGALLGLVFLNPSLRTRASMIAAMAQLGGTAMDLSPVAGTWPLEFQEGAVMNGETVEHIQDAVRVLSRYCHVLGVRASRYLPKGREEGVISAVMRYATVPVVNLESDWYHPCQGLADALTIREALGDPRGEPYAYVWTTHPKPLPQATTHSQLFGAVDLGMRVTLAHPEGWELDSDVVKALERRATQAGGIFRVTHDRFQAVQGARVVCSKSWGALRWADHPDQELQARRAYADWRVDLPLMALTHQAIYLHCLPVRRNVEVVDEVLDGPWSRVIEAAENRLHVQKAILLYCLS